MRTPEPLPEAMRDEPFLVSAAIAAGVSRSRLRGDDLARLFRGVRLPARTADELTMRCRALQQILPAGAFFSHSTAALHLGIPLPSRLELDSRLHIAVVTPTTTPSIRGVVAHEFGTAPSSTAVAGLRLSSPAVTWAALGESLSIADLVAAGDYLVTGHRPLTTIAELETLVATLGGKRGVRGLREALPQIRVGPRSRRESHVRLLAVAAGLPEPVLNLNLFDAAGRFVAMVDTAWPDQRVALESEGRHHQEGAQFRKDVGRRERVEDIGWRLMRATSDDLTFGTAEFVARLARRLGRPISSVDIARAVTLSRTFGR